MPSTNTTPAGMATAGEVHDRAEKMPHANGWLHQHHQAWNGARPRIKHEVSIAEMVDGWLQYADAHRERFDSRIGDDYVLGPAWAKIGSGLRDLLSGETGRFDCGTLDAILNNALNAEGFDESSRP